MNSTSKKAVFALAATSILAFAAVYLFLFDDQNHAPLLGNNGNDAPAVPASSKVGLNTTTPYEDFLKQLKKHESTGNAKSSDEIYRIGLEHDSPDVRAIVFEKTLALAAEEEVSAPAKALISALDSKYLDIKELALIASRDNPSYALTDDLLKYSKMGGALGLFALDALAFSTDPEASNRLCEVATNETMPDDVRLRAIALLSKVDTTGAEDTLIALSKSSNAEFSRIAMTSLDARSKKVSVR